MKQTSFQKRNWKHSLCHGGALRKVRDGRGYRPLSTRESLHLVFKANRAALKTGFRGYRSFFLIHTLIERYARRFWIRIEQVSVQRDHIHLLIRAGKRSNYQAFFRVIAGQIAQNFQSLDLVTDTPNEGRMREGKAREKIRGETKEAKIKVRDGMPRAREGKVGKKDPGEAKAGVRKAVSFWKHRPFTRVVRGGRRAYQTAMNYIRLNEKEARGEIPYRKERLRGLKKTEWESLWS